LPFQSPKFREDVGYGRRVRRLHSVLGGLAGGVHLQQYTHPPAALAADPIQRLCDGDAIHGVNEVRDRGRFGRLVALQRTDQVPAAGRIDRGRLGHHFLDTILTDVGDSARNDLAHHVGRKGLGHGHNRDRAGLTSRTPRGGGDAIPDRFNSGCDGVHSRPT
jgi:hypothetical protein